MHDLDSLIEKFHRVSHNQAAHDFHHERARLATKISDSYRDLGDNEKAAEWSGVALDHEMEGDHLANLRCGAAI